MDEPQLHFAPPGTRRLCVMRYGHAVVREWRIPKPTVLVDTREQQPFSLLQLHPNWIGDLKFATLKTGDYSIEDMEHLLALERKSMIDAIQSTIEWQMGPEERNIVVWTLVAQATQDYRA